MASIPPHRLISHNHTGSTSGLYHRPSYTTPSYMAPANGVEFHSSFVKVRRCWDELNYSCGCHFFVKIANFLQWNLCELCSKWAGKTIESIKHSYSKEDEKKGSHSRAPFGACVTRGYRKEKKTKKVVT